MEKELPLLQVQLFGKDEITYNHAPILLSKGSITRGMKLLLILLHSGKKGVARNTLLDDLFGKEELLDASNSLRVILHRLKKMLSDAGLPEYEYIISQGGFFYWDCPMEMEIDTEIFKGLLKEEQKEIDINNKINILQRACELYKGDFLQRLSADEWVLMEGYRYKEMYENALKDLCQYLMEKQEYETVLNMVDAACKMYPFDEWQAVKIDCYIAMNRYQDALHEYEVTARMLMEELGIAPSARMMQQFKIMSSRITNRPQIISEIKECLKEENYQSGAFYCTYPGFRDTYRLMRRAMERTGQSIYLLVCTLIDYKGHPLENSEKLDTLSEALYDTLKVSLRRTDTFTKYSQAQFLVLLMGTNEENCQIVMKRIRSRFAEEHKSWNSYLECSVASLYEFG